jgi:catechol 2,3-dioxygenase-like lactoylglutathione lyase family enzyme
MSERPGMRFTSTVLGAPDARELAAFYHRLLGWPVTQDEPDWVALRPTDGGTGLSFQTEPAFVRPTWPSRADAQQMMLHLDFEVDDLEAAGAFVVAAGGVLADFQPAEDTRVYLDPVGHPFCIWVRTG